MTDDLLQLADWLAANAVTHVAMESTGVYWKPVWNLLEDRFELLLVNARHVKAVPGRKTDAKDCEWLADLLRHGLLRGSFVPDRDQRELRELTRYRTSLVQERSAEVYGNGGRRGYWCPRLATPRASRPQPRVHNCRSSRSRWLDPPARIRLLGTTPHRVVHGRAILRLERGGRRAHRP